MNLFQKFTLRIVLFLFWKKIKELNSFLFDVTQRIEFFSVWLKELSAFKKYYSMNWIFFFQYYSKTWAFFSHNMTFKNWTFLKNMTQRIELFKCDLEPRIILQFDSNNWIWIKALNPPFQYDSKNWTLFWTWLTETFLSYNNSKNCFVKKYDSQNVKNWTFFSQMTRRLDFSFSNMSDRNNLFFFWKKDDSKNWFSENINQIIQTLFWWLKELSPFFFFFFLKRHDS